MKSPLLCCCVVIAMGCSPTSLRQDGPKTDAGPDRTKRSVEFEGRVGKGRDFIRSFGDGFAFVLTPITHGWKIEVRDQRGTEDISRYTTPLGFGNPRYIEGWHFRNVDNTGPNEVGPKNVNAPQEVREFIFSPEVGRTIASPYENQKPTHEEFARIRRFGRGNLTILESRLYNLIPEQRASFEWMKFRVELSWDGESVLTEIASSRDQPVVVSTSQCDVDMDGKPETVEILLESGRRYDDNVLWAGAGEKWEGYFVIRVRRDNNILSSQSLNKMIAVSHKQVNEIFFWTPEFSLVFEDYNGDGLIDFNIGQYGSSTCNQYWLFTIHRDGRIAELPVADTRDGLGVSLESIRRNSTGSIKKDGHFITFETFSPGYGFFNRWFKWDGTQFVFVKEEPTHTTRKQ